MKRTFAYLVAGVAILLFLTRKAFGGPSFTMDYQAGKTLPKIPFATLFDKWSSYYDVPWQLLVATARRESNFNPSAVNEEVTADERKGRDVDSIGLGQILFPDTAQGLIPGINRQALFEPDTNIKLMAMHYTQLLRRFPDRDEDGFPAQAVSAYNAGHPISGNAGYVRDVKAFWEEYRG